MRANKQQTLALISITQPEALKGAILAIQFSINRLIHIKNNKDFRDSRS